MTKKNYYKMVRINKGFKQIPIVRQEPTAVKDSLKVGDMLTDIDGNKMKVTAKQEAAGKSSYELNGSRKFFDKKSLVELLRTGNNSYNNTNLCTEV